MASDVWMMHFGRNETQHMPPRIMFVGNVLGEEMSSREVLLQLVVYLCDAYRQDLFMKKVGFCLDWNSACVCKCLSDCEKI